jgi:hypothetical protein
MSIMVSVLKNNVYLSEIDRFHHVKSTAVEDCGFLYASRSDSFNITLRPSLLDLLCRHRSRSRAKEFNLCCLHSRLSRALLTLTKIGVSGNLTKERTMNVGHSG